MIRVLVGPALIATGYGRLRGEPITPLGIAAIVAGSMILESAVTRVCPVNALLGLDTRSERERVRDVKSILASHAPRDSAAAEAAAMYDARHLMGSSARVIDPAVTLGSPGR